MSFGAGSVCGRPNVIRAQDIEASLVDGNFDDNTPDSVWPPDAGAQHFALGRRSRARAVTNELNALLDIASFLWHELDDRSVARRDDVQAPERYVGSKLIGVMDHTRRAINRRMRPYGFAR